MSSNIQVCRRGVLREEKLRSNFCSERIGYYFCNEMFALVTVVVKYCRTLSLMRNSELLVWERANFELLKAKVRRYRLLTDGMK